MENNRKVFFMFNEVIKIFLYVGFKVFFNIDNYI